jgi:crossover junction endodeoxyribonuclease RusA
MMLTVMVPGTPAPQGSKIAGRHGGVFEASSKALRNWRPDVAREIRRAMDAGPFPDNGGPAYVSLLFIMPRPKGDYGTGKNAGKLRPGAASRPAKSPDIDKLARAVLDGIVLGGALADDSQIIDLALSKIYATSTTRPGVEITIRDADPAWPLVAPMTRQLARADVTGLPGFEQARESLARSAELVRRINAVGPEVTAELKLGGRAPGIYVNGEGPL